MRIGQSRNSAVTVMNNRNTNICRGYENRYPKRNLEHQTGQMPYRRRLSDTEAAEGYLPENIQRAMMVEAPERGAIYLVDFALELSSGIMAASAPDAIALFCARKPASLPITSTKKMRS